MPIANPGADTNATAANEAPAIKTSDGQAPDDVMKRLSDLVHAGKYAEAQQSVTALLILYPDDQRLIKAKALLDKSPVAPGSPSATPDSNQPPSNATSVHPIANTNSEQLTGMDTVDYNALIELARQAQQSTDLEQQNASLNQFMNQSTPFLQKHPDQMLLWQLRAASAISLHDPMAGYEAGQKLIAAGAADTPAATATNAEPLTGMDKVDRDSLIELARKAQQSNDLEQQKKLLQQFMDRSSPFLQKHPNEMLLWQIRAASAISQDDPFARNRLHLDEAG